MQSLLYAYSFLWLKPPLMTFQTDRISTLYLAIHCQTFFLTAKPEKNTDTCVSIFNFVWSRYLCKELKTSGTLLLKPFSKFWEQALRWSSFLWFCYHCSFRWSHRLFVHKMEHFIRMEGERREPSVNILGYTSPLKVEIFLIQYCTVLEKPPMTSSLSSFA